MRPARTLSLLALVALAPLALGACGNQEGSHTVGDVREQPRSGPSSPSAHTLSNDERFGRSGHGAAGQQAPTPPKVKWLHDTPEGWEVLPSRPMRDLGWQVAGDESAECTFTFLPGGGGLADNVNRWRRQMGLEPIAEDAVAALPQGKLIERPATLVELDGTYGGMRGDVNLENAKMLGLIVSRPQGSLFLKMTGPAAVVEAEKARFTELAHSIRVDMTGHGMPPGHGARGGSAEPAPRAAGVAWDLPEGWEAQRDRPFREATWRPTGAKNTEIWVSVLTGDGGGLVQNVNRWQKQMGQPELSPEEIQGLPKLEAMGIQGTLVTIDGAYNAGMGGGSGKVDKAMMMGFALLRGTDSVFVKMVGPSDEVHAHKEAFEAFSRSLRTP